MPQIRPFKGIRPANDWIDQVIARPSDVMYSEEAERIKANNTHSFLHLMEPRIDNPYQRGSVQEMIFKKISENFHEFWDNGVLIEDHSPAFYLYRITTAEHSFTGIWTCSAIDDYLNNTIKKHELTRSEREQGLIDYFEHTGIDGNPVIVAYPSNSSIKSIIQQKQALKADVSFETEGNQHEVWVFRKAEEIEQLIRLFQELPAAYIADGHHRAAAASILGIQRRKSNLRHNGTESYNYFSSIYYAADELLIYEFHRLIKDLGGLNLDELLKALENDFTVEKQATIVKPEALHKFGMYVNKEWYLLTAKAALYDVNNAVDKLDVSILHQHILDPILHIKDAKTDKRIDFMGGIRDISELIRRVDAGEMQIGFTLYPTSIEELIAVADNGDVMPPKSTWFEPKLHCGLIIHYLG